MRKGCGRGVAKVTEVFRLLFDDERRAMDPWGSSLWSKPSILYAKRDRRDRHLFNFNWNQRWWVITVCMYVYVCMYAMYVFEGIYLGEIPGELFQQDTCIYGGHHSLSILYILYMHMYIDRYYIYRYRYGYSLYRYRYRYSLYIYRYVCLFIL